ncbi:MAG: hypothetical protein MUC43_13370 [Pirellula sp.]|jgi:hypothetical protein|nr:hypothetical protein [Pirellula sp.]
MRTTPHIKTSIAALALAVGLTGASNGQSDGPAIAAPMMNWEFVDRSSTFAEGAQRGYASVLRGAGELAYMDSLAAINYQEAFRKALENRVAYTKAAMEIKAMRAEYRERYAPRPFVGEARKRAIEFYLPKKLTATQFNADTSEIVWPHILRQSEYAPICTEINQVFKSRTFENSGDGSPTQLTIDKLTKSLAALLRENINSMSAEQYIYASEFIRSLNLEGKSIVPPRNNVEVEPAKNELIESTPPAMPQTDKPADPGTIPVKVRAKI